MKEILIATKNKGKVIEFEKMFEPLDYKVKSLLDYPEIEDIEETGDSFQENAMLKAETISKKFNTTTIADDSGLLVDALDGRPGIYSARYAGEEKNDEANMNKLLDEMENIPLNQRTARFCAVLALAVPGKPTLFFEGYCEGIIGFDKKGDHGFGYDPLFYLPHMDQTMAEISQEVKNKISHRAKAMDKLKTAIKEGALSV